MNVYDEIPYPVYSHVTTHPAALATMAALHGLNPPPLETASVLELGCASGGNIIPMALGLPAGRLVGVDNSVRQIDTAQAYASALSLDNLSLRCIDMLDIDAGFGQFDYIVAHGVFSWVGTKQQDKIFEICQNNLSPQGVAFVSYNTLPGWRSLSVIRDMLLYHTRNASDPQTQTSRARSLLNFLSQTTTVSRSTPVGGLLQAYAEFFRVQLENLSGSHDSYLLHEMLEEVNDPVYFSEFIERANRYGLQYLSDMDFRETLAANQDANLTQGLLNMARDKLEWEQYLDFVKGRTFRQSLLVHQGPAISRTMKPETLMHLYVSSAAQPVALQNTDPDAVQDFGDPETMAVSTDHPVTKAAMNYLAEIFPQSAMFDDVFRTALQRLGRTSVDDHRAAFDARILASSLLTAFTYSNQLVGASVFRPQFVTEVSQRPVASPWARLQVLDGFSVTNLRHERIDLNPLLAYLLRYLDGTRDESAVLDALMAGPVAGKKLAFKDDEQQPIEDTGKIRQILAPETSQAILRLAKAALLVA